MRTFILFLVLLAICFANTVTVCNSGCCDFDEIQTAVDSATQGDTINVYEGNWEGAIIRKFITVQAQCGLGPVCDVAKRNPVRLAKVHMASMKKEKKANTMVVKPKKSSPVKPTKAKKAPPPKPTKKSKKGTTCIPDRVKIVSGPRVNTALLTFGGFQWQSGFVVLSTAAHIRGFRFLCETVETSADSDLAFGVSVVGGVNAADAADGGSIEQNSFLECHRGIHMQSASEWSIKNNFFSIGTAFVKLGLDAEPKTACNFVFLTGNSNLNQIDSNTGIINGNTAQDDKFFPCSAVGIYGTTSIVWPVVLGGNGDPIPTAMGNVISNNNIKSTEVTVGRVIGVSEVAATFTYIFQNHFDSLTHDVWFSYAASRNTVYSNEFVQSLSDSIRIGGGSFANNITTNTIDGPGGIGIHHLISQDLSWGSSGAEVITDNSILRSTGCGINTPDPATNTFALPDILYNNYGNLCVY